MSIETFLSSLVYMIITATTPGPNNILALNSVVNYGYSESKRLILGIYAGFASVMMLGGFGCHFLVEILPDILGILTILGVGYVLYLAYKVAISKPQGLEKESEKLGFFEAFLLQFVNVKIILYAITIHASFVLPHYQSLVWTGAFVLLSCVVGFSGIFLWAMAGVALKTFLLKHYKIANLTMAFLLVLSAVQIVLG